MFSQKFQAQTAPVSPYLLLYTKIGLQKIHQHLADIFPQHVGFHVDRLPRLPVAGNGGVPCFRNNIDFQPPRAACVYRKTDPPQGDRPLGDDLPAPLFGKGKRQQWEAPRSETLFT